MRAKTIQSLIKQTTEFFITHLDALTAGEVLSPLSQNIESADVLNCIKRVSAKRIYNYRPVIEIEAAGFEVLGGLLEIITDAVLEKLNSRREKVIQLLPSNIITPESDQYEKLMRINDYVSGMTDNFAISMYRKLKGISLPRVY